MKFTTWLVDIREARREERQGGFTLVELLIVIVILAILAAIVVFAVGTTTHNAVAASCSADAKSVESAMSAYDAQMGSYPASVGALTGTTTDANGNTVGPWLRQAPGTAHYLISINGASIYLDNPTGPYNATDANNFDVTPNICASFT